MCIYGRTRDTRPSFYLSGKTRLPVTNFRLLRRKATVKQAPDAMLKKGPEPPAAGSKAGDQVETEDDPDREYDLNDPGECIQWMLSAWTCLPEEAEPICKYYVETHLKPKACKGKPLAHWFVTEVVSAQLLKTKDGRKKFLQAWGANRATRFSKGPKALWSKKG